MKALYWDSATSKAAPIGCRSSVVLAAVAVTGLLFRTLTAHAGQFVVALLAYLMVIAYLAFCPALAFSLYSLVFEQRKRPAIVGLALAVVTGVAAPVLVDSALLLPFAFLAVLGVVKFARWQSERDKPPFPAG